MKMKYNNIFLCAVASLSILSGCDKWTQPEALDFDEGMKTPSAEYLASLRAFKESDHKVMIVSLDGTSSAPVSQKQHPMAMPDSADWIAIRNAGDLNGLIANELGEVREKKGTRSVSVADFAEIKAAWGLVVDAREEAGKPAPSETEQKAFYKNYTDSLLAFCNKYGFDGVMLSYTGVTADAVGTSGYFEAIHEWKSANPTKVMMIRGTTLSQITDAQLLSDCKYLIIPMTTDYSPNMLSSTMKSLCRRLSEENKLKLVFETYVPSDAYPQREGFEPQPIVAASWIFKVDEGYTKLGLCVNNSADDYGSGNTFSVIRTAITVLNKIRPETGE